MKLLNKTKALIRFTLSFIDDQKKNEVVIHSGESKDLYQLRGWLIEQGVECDTIKSEILYFGQEDA